MSGALPRAMNTTLALFAAARASAKPASDVTAGVAAFGVEETIASPPSKRFSQKSQPASDQPSSPSAEHARVIVGKRPDESDCFVGR